MVGVAVEVVVCGGDDGRGVVEVGSLGVLPLPLVGVLVAAEGLGGGEVPAAVVALELPAALPSSTTVGGGGGVGAAAFVVVGCGAFIRVCGGGEIDAEEADARGSGSGGCGGGFGGGAGGGPEEGELREGVNVHEIMCLRIFSCSSGGYYCLFH